MKKFLLVLLIAFVASVTVQIDHEELNSWISKQWEKLKNWVDKLTGKVKDLYNWLKDSGNLDQIMALVKAFAVPSAVALCTSLTGLAPICTEVINIMASNI